MKIITYPPTLIGHGQRGVWKITVKYSDGRTHSNNYLAYTMNEARRRYLMEFGPVMHGEIEVELVKKIS